MRQDGDILTLLFISAELDLAPDIIRSLGVPDLLWIQSWIPDFVRRLPDLSGMTDIYFVEVG
jgi:hypothetical protein